MEIISLDLAPNALAGITEKTHFEFHANTDDGKPPTKSQLRMLDIFISQYFHRNCFTLIKKDHKYEFKMIHINIYNAFISVVIETGSKGDENTLAAMVCRNRVHAFIGRNGGIRAEGKVTRTGRSCKVRGLRRVCSLSHY